MANIKSAKKQARQNIVRRKRNLARKTSIKTIVKKISDAVEKGEAVDKVKELLKEASAKIARAKNKHLLHRNTASRKIGKLAKKVAVYARKKA